MKMIYVWKINKQKFADAIVLIFITLSESGIHADFSSLINTIMYTLILHTVLVINIHKV